MQKVDQVVDKINTQQLSKDSNQCQTEKRLDGGRIKRIFAIMQTTYGSLWVDKVGSKELMSIAFDRWSKKLYGLTDQQIAKGLDNLPDDFPPTEGKFRKICEGTTAGLTTNTAAYKPFDKRWALEKKADKEIARKCSAEARKYLGR